MFIVTIWQDLFEQAGWPGVAILAGYVSLSVGAVLWLAWSIAMAGVRALRRTVHRWQLRRELRLLRGGRAMFTDYGELVDRPPRPPIRSLRTRRGDHDAA
jgi:hypothetical protein